MLQECWHKVKAAEGWQIGAGNEGAAVLRVIGHVAARFPAKEAALLSKNLLKVWHPQRLHSSDGKQWHAVSERASMWDWNAVPRRDQCNFTSDLDSESFPTGRSAWLAAHGSLFHEVLGETWQAFCLGATSSRDGAWLACLQAAAWGASCHGHASVVWQKPSSRCAACSGSARLHAAAGSSGRACVGPAPAQQRRRGWRLGGRPAGGLRGAPGALRGRRQQGRCGRGPCQGRVAGVHRRLHCRRGKYQSDT